MTTSSFYSGIIDCKEETIFPNTTLHVLQLSSLRKLKSCVHYTGILYISKESFQRSPQFPDPIEDVNELYNLLNLRSIVGYIYFDLSEVPEQLTNLTFLENLESVVLEVKNQSPGSVITIMNGENIELFGFKSLTNIGGYVYLRNLPKLCYISALTKMSHVITVDVQEEEICAGDHCVSKCTDRPGFYEIPTPVNHTNLRQTEGGPVCRTLPLTKSQIAEMDEQSIASAVIPAKTCAACHPECAQTCYGPNANQCVGECKHYQVSKVKLIVSIVE
ncbi:unnamed protein product [Trichobilharzia regenti]|nr:unnamed protein product [Trichobilharzia regenti]